MAKRESVFDRRRTTTEPVVAPPPAPAEPATVTPMPKADPVPQKKSRRDGIETALMRVTTKKQAHNQLKAVSGHIGLTLQDFAVVAINRLLLDLHTASEQTLEDIKIDPNTIDTELLVLLSRMQLTLPSMIGKDDPSVEIEQ